VKPLKPILAGLSIISIVVCLWAAFPDVAASASNGAEQLRKTMADISLLNNQLAQRRADAARLREELAKRMEEIKAEIREKATESKIKDEKEALKTPRILFDLQLIAEIQAYMKRYAREMNYYQVACDRLGYLYQQADDDLKIVNTLSGMKIGALVSQTEKIVNAYLPDAQTIVIQPDSMVIASPESVWKSLDWAR
jgi:chromosome segregation ATPase